MRPLLAGFLLVLAAAPAPCEPAPSTGAGPAASVVRAWDATLSDLLRRERQGPLSAARAIGLLGVAMHEASGEPSLAGRLSELPAMPAATTTVDRAACVNAAAARMASALFKARGDDVTATIAATESANEVGAAAETLDASRAHGRAVADAVLAWASGDGFAKLDACAWQCPEEPGKWAPTAPQFRQQPLGPCWGTLRPMALDSPDVPLGAPIPYSEDPASPFHAAAMEVRDAVDRQDPKEQEIALFWSDDPGATGTPPAHWLAILDQVSSERNLRDAQVLRARAALGIALHDAAIACWRAKYAFAYIRPITYIQKVGSPSWVPLLQTPPFPEHPSGHAVFSAAAARVLDATIGDAPFQDRTRAARGHAPRDYASFDAAAEEAAMSRLFAGIHFRRSCEQGLVQGRAVGDAVMKQIDAAPRSP